MFRAMLVLAAFGLTMGAAVAQTSAPPAPAPRAAADDAAHRKADIAKHRQMAAAHAEAALCLERGEKESVCQERLRDACKGIAVGRYCGMRHEH